MNFKWVLMLLGTMVYTPISFTYPFFLMRMSQFLSPQNMLTPIPIMILPPILLRKFKQTEDFHRLPTSQLTSFYLWRQVNYLFPCHKPIPPPASQIPSLSFTGGHYSSNCPFSVLKVIIFHSLLIGLLSIQTFSSSSNIFLPVSVWLTPSPSSNILFFKTTFYFVLEYSQLTMLW